MFSKFGRIILVLVLSSGAWVHAADDALTVAPTDGNVGVGTSTPQSKLDVNGGVRVQGQTQPASGKGLELGYDQTYNISTVFSYDRDTPASRPLVLQPSGGNVGIWTGTVSAPTEALQIGGTGNLRVGGVIKAGSVPTTLTGADGNILSSALNTVQVAQGGTGVSSANANLVFATPNGSSGAPTFRSLFEADIPSLSASKLTSGTLSNDRLSASVTLMGNTFNLASQLVQMTAAAKLPAVDGSLLTGLTKTQVGLGNVPNVDCSNAGNISSGTLSVARGGTNSGTALSGSSIMISNGTAIVQGAAGTATTVLHGNASGAPTFGAVALTTDVSGVSRQT